MATILGCAVGNGESGHIDYRYGWLDLIGNAWQCMISAQIPGRTCTPHDAYVSNISQITDGGPVFRLIYGVLPTASGKKLVDLNRELNGSKRNHYLTIPALKSNAHKHGLLTIETR